MAQTAKNHTGKQPKHAKRGSLNDIVQRYHSIAFFVIIIVSLAVAIFFLNSIVVQSDASTDYAPTEETASFDEATIERLRELTPSSQSPQALETPSGRTNPFSD